MPPEYTQWRTLHGTAFTRLLLIKFVVLDEVISKISAIDEVHNQEQILSILECVSNID